MADGLRFVVKVFISWSGARSRIVAEALREWLPNVINAVEPFVSEEDIDKGAIGTEVIARHLHDSIFGIVCLTRDNQARPWINYEAGALSKVVGDNEARVATVLIDIESPAGVTGPLSAFQATRLRDLADMKQLVRSIAKVAGDTRSKETLDNFVSLIWDSFAVEVTEERLAASGEASAVPARQPGDMFGELLTLIRQMSQDMSRIIPRPITVERSTFWNVADSPAQSIRSAGAAILEELEESGVSPRDRLLRNIPPLSPNLQLFLKVPLSPDLKSRLLELASDLSVVLQIRDWGKEDEGTLAISGL